MDSTEVIIPDVQTAVTDATGAAPTVYEGAGVTQTSADLATADLALQQAQTGEGTLRQLFLATLHAYPDSLTGGPLIASSPGGIMLLIDGTNPVRGSRPSTAQPRTSTRATRRLRGTP